MIPLATATFPVPAQRTGRLKLVAMNGEVFYVSTTLTSNFYAITTSSVANATVVTGVVLGGPQRLRLQASVCNKPSSTNLPSFQNMTGGWQEFGLAWNKDPKSNPTQAYVEVTRRTDPSDDYAQHKCPGRSHRTKEVVFRMAYVGDRCVDIVGRWPNHGALDIFEW